MFKVHVSLDVLPQNALEMRDNQFYSLVEQLTSPEVSQILKSQCINSINTYLLCKKISESILLPTSAFDAIRRDTCVKLDQNNNNAYVVHVGIVGQIDYLTELFRKKHNQEAKSNSKHHPTSNVNSVLDHSLPSVIDSSSINPNAIAQQSSDIDYRSKIISTVNKWLTSQFKSNGLNPISLVEGTNYTLHISPSIDTIIITCQCTTRVSIPKSTDKGFSLSNLYKHWKNAKQCNIYKLFESSCSSPAYSSSSSNDIFSNDDDHDDDNNDHDQDLILSSPTFFRPNTRSQNKRVASTTLSTINISSAKRRRY